MAKVLLNLVEMHNISVKITLFLYFRGVKVHPIPYSSAKTGSFCNI